MLTLDSWRALERKYLSTNPLEFFHQEHMSRLYSKCMTYEATCLPCVWRACFVRARKDRVSNLQCFKYGRARRM